MGGLPEAARAEVAGLWDERRDSCGFAFPDGPDGAGRCRRVPVVVAGLFRDPDEPGDDRWRADYFEYLLKYPDLLLIQEPIRRTFHFGCTAHPAARAVLAAGTIPADFACPLDPADGPMRAMLAACPGHSLRLVALPLVR